MKSNYKRIGDFIRPIKVKNIDSSDKSLLGININKYFMPSVANVVGTDLSRYKIVKKGQFSCNRMHVGRDKRLPVALSNQEDDFIVSPAYDVFEIFDKNILLPEYLMMWFSRKEFDRNAWFYTDADVRGGLHWDAFCNIQLPVPDIEKQKAIVKEYYTIVNRIKLNEQLNQKLEETAQAIYKQWFVDFEFPMTKEYAESIGKPELAGKPYKSDGGEMVWNDELGKEIPAGWSVTEIGNLIEYKKGFAFKSNDYRDKGVKIVRVSNFTYNSIDINNCFFIDYNKSKEYSEFMLKESDIIISTVGSWPNNPDSIVGKVIKVPMLADKSLLNQNAVRLRSKDKGFQLFLYNGIAKENFSEYVISGAQGSANQASITLKHIFGYKIVYPTHKYREVLFPFFDKLSHAQELRNKENYYQYEMSATILSRMSKV